MVVSYKELYLNRCVTSKGKSSPTFWRPPTVKSEPFGFWGSSDLPIPEDWGVERLMQVIIGMGLVLELPVGEFIRSGLKGELPSEQHDGVDYVKKLFLTNSADEARHYKGMINAAQAYPIPEDIMRDCERLKDAWVDLNAHPILKAGSLESGIFLVNLAILRLFGSADLSTLGRGISMDERRHVITNRNVVKDLGLNPWNPGKELMDLMIDSFNYLFEGFNPKDSEVHLGIEINKDFFIQSGIDLLTTGLAPTLDQLVRTMDYNPPFEAGNASLYDRDVEELDDPNDLISFALGIEEVQDSNEFTGLPLLLV